MPKSIQIVCAHCDAVNRAPADKDASLAKCGKCGQKLFDGHPAEVSDAGLKKQIERSGVPVVVDFWAGWCGPCRAMAPAYAAAAAELEPNVRFLKVDVDRHKEVAGSLGVQGIPALFLFRNGEVASRQTGALSAPQLKAWIVSATRTN